MPDSAEASSRLGTYVTTSVSGNPSTSCFPAIASTGTTFTVTGQIGAQAGMNLNLSVAFTSGPSSGAIMGTAALDYLGAPATGTFSFAGGSIGM